MTSCVEEEGDLFDLFLRDIKIFGLIEDLLSILYSSCGK